MNKRAIIYIDKKKFTSLTNKTNRVVVKELKYLKFKKFYSMRLQH
jgi:hypothetical protein